MSLTPEQLQKLAQPLIDIYLAIESDLLKNLARTIARFKNLVVTTEDGLIDYQHWRLVQLNNIGQLTNENIKILSQYSGATVKEIKDMIKLAGYESIAADEEIYRKAIKKGLLPNASLSTVESVAVGNILLAYQKQALKTFNLINTTMLNQSKQIYLDTINKVVGKMLTGTITHDQAIRETVQEWSKTGIPSLIDKRGRKWTTEAYVSMVARSTSNNVANETQFARMDEFESDLLEVSSHLGARPKCYPWQGAIYSRSGKHPDYKAWSETSYGDVAGLLGINCRHKIYPFFEGLSKP
ncbi:phage minor capsid protein, partial [Bacillus velezensis]|uniref:phage minor capsid protein n=1 Tax=Bacillus velezensis TaxID=492670 RepID=UPI002FFFF822